MTDGLHTDTVATTTANETDWYCLIRWSGLNIVLCKTLICDWTNEKGLSENILYVTGSVKTGLIYTSNYWYSFTHIFTSKYGNQLKFATFIVLCLLSHISKFCACSIYTGWVMYPKILRIECADKTCFRRFGHIFSTLLHHNLWYTSTTALKFPPLIYNLMEHLAIPYRSQDIHHCMMMKCNVLS